MSISRKDVAHIADLARIELTKEETEQYEKELSGILAFIEKLNLVDTASTEPATGGTDLENIMRLDGPLNTSLEEKQTALLAAAPAEKNGWIEVKTIFQ